MDDPVLSDGLLVLGSMAVLVAPMALALADMGPGGAGWKVLSFLCCAFAGWSFFFTSTLLMALAGWVLAWACALALRVRFFHRRS